MTQTKGTVLEVGGFVTACCVIAAMLLLCAATYFDLDWPPARLRALYRIMVAATVISFLAMLFLALAVRSWIPGAMPGRRFEIVSVVIMTALLFLIFVNYFLSPPSSVRLSSQRWEAADGRWGAYHAVSDAEAAERLRRCVRWMAGGPLLCAVLCALHLLGLLMTPGIQNGDASVFAGVEHEKTEGEGGRPNRGYS